MHFNPWIPLLFSGLTFAVAPLAAQTATEQLQMSQCLASHLNPDYRVLAENRTFKILDVPSFDLNSIALLADTLSCGRFVNVSHRLKRGMGEDFAKTLLSQPRKGASTAFWEIQHQDAVIQALDLIKVEHILATLNHMTGYYNRSSTKRSGVDVAHWLKHSFETVATARKRSDTASWFVSTGPHYIQPSLVTVIGKDIKAPAIVIGAHMDTLDGRMPGAGDDASGSASVMEMARVLLESPLKLKHPVYFIWYAAEERGLVGSQFVVADFIKKSIPVKAAIQFDMTGFRSNPADPTMWVYRDFTDNALTDFVAKLVDTYVGVPVAESSCGYGCSDHVSWMDAGIPAAFPCESNFENHNTSIHTPMDTADKLVPEHMANFTRLGVAFAIELAMD